MLTTNPTSVSLLTSGNMSARVIVADKTYNTGQNLKIALATGGGTSFFNPETIICCKAKSNYTLLYFTGRLPLLVPRTLKKFEDQLCHHDFIRVHKSHLVNKKHVLYLDNKNCLWLTGGTKLLMSRRRKKEVMKLLTSGAQPSVKDNPHLLT